jgi:hypothetical protein
MERIDREKDTGGASTSVASYYRHFDFRDLNGSGLWRGPSDVRAALVERRLEAHIYGPCSRIMKSRFRAASGPGARSTPQLLNYLAAPTFHSWR